MATSRTGPALARWSAASAALLTLSLLVAASPLPSLDSQASPSTSPTDPVAVVLRMELSGGLAGSDLLSNRVPPFTLFDDGTVVYLPLDSRLDPPLDTTLLSEEQVEAVLEMALDEAGLRTARSHSRAGAADDGISVLFTVDADGVRKRVRLPAPETWTGTAGAEAPLDILIDTLMAFETWLPADAVTSPYEPPAYRAVFNEIDAEGVDLRPWPWTDLSPDDLRAVPDAPALRWLDLSPDQAAMLDALPSGGVMGIGVESERGPAYIVSMRPLLPDEIAGPLTGD